MNPVIPTVFSADPAARVWPNDERLFIYGSHDEPDTNTHFTMKSYHVFSTLDMVNWTDHGVALHLKDVEWASSHMWAIDATYWKGNYYLVYCAYQKGTSDFRTALAISPRPEGPFKDIGPIEGVKHGQDPALFIDDDNTPYLYWGYGKQCFGVELNDDLMSAKPETYVELTDQLKWVYEGPWVHKYNGKYYLSYPGLFEDKWPETMFYAMADKPLGPYKFMGEYIPQFEGCAGTNHGSITEYKGQWYAFHHSQWISDKSEVRSVMCDYLNYNEDGSIIPIKPTKEGVASPDFETGPSRVTIELDAASVEMQCGELWGTKVSTEREGYTGAGYVCGFDYLHAGIVFFVQSGIEKSYNLIIRYIAENKDEENGIIVNNRLIQNPNLLDQEMRFEETITFPQTTEWKEVDAGVINLKTGDNTIRITTNSGGIEIDKIILKPVE